MRSHLLAVALCASLGPWTANGAHAGIFHKVLSGTIHGGLADVFALPDGVHAWGVYGQTVIRTEDGGQTWEQIRVAMSEAEGFSAIYFLDPDEGWAVTGYAGTIFHSTDGGRTWEPNHFSDQWLNDVFFYDSLHGWAVGTYCNLYTWDGGASWNLNDTAAYGDLSNVVFVSPLEGWTAGGGRIWHSSDGGATWTMQLTGAGGGFQGISFADPLRGCAVGGRDGAFMSYSTIDGGQTWVPFVSGAAWKQAWDVSLEPGGTGCAVGWHGLLLATLDAGQTWIRQDSGLNNSLWSACARPHVAWAAGEHGAILTRHGDEPGWTRIVDLSNPFRVVAFWDSLRILIAGDLGRIFRTEDGGAHWEEVWVGGGELSQPLGMDVGPTGLAWIGGDGGGVWRSEDYGRTWRSPQMPIEGRIQEMDFVDARRGWCITMTGGTTDQGHVLATADGGESWFEQPGGLGYSWTCLAALDSLHVWVAGWEPARAVVRRSTDGGLSWAQVALPTEDAPWSLFFASSEVGWCGTDGGIVYMTADGGENWRPIHDGGAGVAWLDLAMIGDWGLAVCGARQVPGPEGTEGLIDIAEFTGSGQPQEFHWIRDLQAPGSHLLSLAFASEWHGLAAGVWGEVFAWSPSADAPGPGRPPARVALCPPWPNPFHPPARLTFELPAESPVRLDVFGVHGQRVGRLADGTFGAGRHSLLWDAQDLASGVYVIRLDAAGQVKTTRAILIR